MTRKIKVVVVSGKLSMNDIEELEAHGIAYFNKPLRYAEIVDELIRQYFQRVFRPLPPERANEVTA